MDVCIVEDEQQRNYVDKPEGWTKDDKFNLYQALKTCGSSDIEVIKSMLPHKSTEDINHMIAYFKDKAMRHPTVSRKNKKKRVVNNLGRVPLAMWAKSLTESLNYTELQTETANALRLIAECERIPDSRNTSNIDFRLIYNSLADAMEGKSLPDDPNVNHIIETCIVETAYTSKSFILSSALRYIIDTIDLDIKHESVFPRPTENNELAIIRHLASQRNYNPLNVTEKFLKPSLYDKE